MTARFAVAVRGLSPAVLEQSAEFLDELLREVRLTISRPGDVSPLTERLLALITRIREAGDGRELLLTSFRKGHTDVDLDLPVGAEHDFLQLALILDEIDGACRRGQLLTLPRPPRLVRVNWWVCTEIVRQRHGLTATPFPV